MFAILSVKKYFQVLVVNGRGIPCQFVHLPRANFWG